MTDQQLIDETAAAIAEDLFAARDDTWLLLYDNLGVVKRWGKPKTRELLARHLTAMLEKQQQAELSAVERILYPPDEELAS